MTINEIKAIAREEFGVEDCYLRGNKARLIASVEDRFNTLAMFQRTIGQPGNIKSAEDYERQCAAFKDRIGV